MLKKFVALMCAFGLALSMVACSSNGDVQTDAPPAEHPVAEEDDFGDEPAEDDFEEVAEEVDEAQADDDAHAIEDAEGDDDGAVAEEGDDAAADGEYAEEGDE